VTTYERKYAKRAGYSTKNGNGRRTLVIVTGDSFENERIGSITFAHFCRLRRAPYSLSFIRTRDRKYPPYVHVDYLVRDHFQNNNTTVSTRLSRAFCPANHNFHAVVISGVNNRSFIDADTPKPNDRTNKKQNFRKTFEFYFGVLYNRILFDVARKYTRFR